MNIRLSTKFMIGMGLIVSLAVGSLSILFYEYVKTVYVQQTFQQTDLVFGHVDATIKYIDEELRPKMFHILPKDEFVLEAMSTSFVNKGVMDRFTKLFPEYVYRRVALNPMGANGRANAFETGYIKKFSEHPNGELNWKGLVSIENRDFFIHLKGVRMEKKCGVCHGDPSISPQSLINSYGSVNGHHWPVGEIVGLVSMAIPMDAIIIADSFGIIQDINNAGLELLDIGSVPAESEKPCLHDLFVSAGSRDQFFQILRASGFVKDYETVFGTASGTSVHVLVSAVCKQPDGSGCDGYECIIKDITERKKMELQLRQADKLASVGQLAAGVAHEINNPLSIVLGYTKFLKKERNDTALQADLDIIYNNAETCKKIIEDLLNFARQTKTRPSETNIHDTIDSAVSVVEANFTEGKISILKKYDQNLPPVILDVGKMRQVFMNLILNACQAMEGGGCLTLSTRYDPTSRGFYVSVADTGSGIAADIRGKIFDPFLRPRNRGMEPDLGSP